MIPENATISPTDLAWAAGLIDGEGSIGIYPFKTYNNPKYKFYYTLALCVRMTHGATVQHIKDMFNVGSVSHRVSRKINHKDSWTWIAYSQQALFVIQQILPYLVTKADQANLAIEFQSKPNHQGLGLPPEVQEHRKKLAERMYQLKRL